MSTRPRATSASSAATGWMPRPARRWRSSTPARATIAAVPAAARRSSTAPSPLEDALPAWLDTTPKERAELLHKLADVLEENAEELSQLESRNVGEPLMASRDEMPFSADNLRFFAGAARHLEGQSAGEYIAGYTSMIRREPLGIVGGIFVELPADDGRLEDGACACGRQHPDPEALGADAPVAPALRPARAGRAPRRCPERRDRGRCPRRRAPRRASRRSPRVAHGRRLTGKAMAQRGRHAEPRPLGAGRQGADGGLRRRQPGGGRRRHPPRRVLELGQDCTAGSASSDVEIYDRLLEALVPQVASLKVGDPFESDEIEMGWSSRRRSRSASSASSSAPRERPSSPAAARTATAASCAATSSWT